MIVLRDGSDAAENRIRIGADLVDDLLNQLLDFLDGGAPDGAVRRDRVENAAHLVPHPFEGFRKRSRDIRAYALTVQGDKTRLYSSAGQFPYRLVVEDGPGGEQHLRPAPHQGARENHSGLEVIDSNDHRHTSSFPSTTEQPS
ncbi:hypothetical protein SDC9_187454 [bioreactor metagenome]|uniref:Uncharacterized protein n=1 Tax=bioreactor metagenome TaxID=1076179 RepID=A0A645HM84_9ZZZZ